MKVEFSKMDKDKTWLIQDRIGARQSIVKVPPPPPPKPMKSKINDSSNENPKDLDNDGFPTIPPPPPLPSAVQSLAEEAIQQDQLEREVVEASAAAEESAAASGGITETLQEEGKTHLTGAKDELINELLGNGEEEDGDKEEPKSVASLLTKELINLTMGNNEETEDAEDDLPRVIKPSAIKNQVKKVLPKSEKTEEDNAEEEETSPSPPQLEKEEEKGGGEGEQHQDEEEDGEDDEDDCDIFNPKKWLLSGIKYLLKQAKPYIQTLFTNLFGVFVGAAVAYSALSTGPDEPCPDIHISNTYKPIQSFTVSPISGIKSETSQPWLTISLDPLIYGALQLQSPGESSALLLESTSLILNVSHFDEVKSASNVSSASELNPVYRTHVVSFRVKRDTEKRATVNSTMTIISNLVVSSVNTTTHNATDSNVTAAMPLHEVNSTTMPIAEEPPASELAITVIHEQIGSSTQFEHFIPLVPEVQEKLTHLHLRYLVVSPQLLLESLKFAQKLHVLELDQIFLMGHFDGRVQLPSITKFYMHIVNYTGSEAGTFIPPIAPIKTFLFFDKNGYWRIEKVTATGVDIDLIFDGRKYFHMNHSKKQLMSQLLMTNLILRHLDLNEFPIESLRLAFIELDIDLIPADISYLSLYSVTFSNNWSLTDLFKRLNNLKSLELNAIGHTLDVSDLTHLPLKHLAYGRSTVGYSPGVLFNLNSIYLENIHGDSQFFEHFHNIFNGTRVAVSTLPPIQFPHSFLKKVFQMDSVKWIYMENFDRQPTFPQARQGTKGQQVLDFEEVEWFLINCGVPATVEVFLLEKDLSTGHWNGRGITVEEHKYLWFNLFSMENFWTRSAVNVFNGMKGQKFITYYLNNAAGISTAQNQQDELMTV